MPAPAIPAGNPEILACGQSADDVAAAGLSNIAVISATVTCNLAVTSGARNAFVVEGNWAAQSLLVATDAHGSATGGLWRLFVASTESTHTAVTHVAGISAAVSTGATLANGITGVSAASSAGPIVNTVVVFKMGTDETAIKAFYGGVGAARDVRLAFKRSDAAGNAVLTTTSIATTKPSVGRCGWLGGRTLLHLVPCDDGGMVSPQFVLLPVSCKRHLGLLES